MKNWIFIVITLLSVSLQAQITFNPNQNSIGNPGGTRPTLTLNGPQTGDDLRAFIVANPTTGTVTDRDIVFNAELIIRGTLTDNNAVYQFPDIYRYAPQTGATVTFTDVTIHYTGTPKGHSYNFRYTANFTRVFYLIGTTGGRSDFFNNGNYTFNFTDVTFVDYGGGDFLHFQTSQTLNNITIVNAAGGLAFEPGARPAGQTEIVNNLKLRGVTRIIGGSGAAGDFKVFDLDWDALNWNFTQRNVDFLFVNPIKPAGWNAYTGQATRVKEFYTHDVTVTDNLLNPISGVRVALLNENDAVFDYDLNTDAQGEIPTQEVLIIDNSRGLNFNRGNSVVVIPEYSKKYIALPRTFDRAFEDNIVTEDDINISEPNSTTVAAYPGITIDHNAQTITISENTTLCELYDFAKLDKVNNVFEPNLLNQLVTANGETLDIRDYQFILTGTAVIAPCDKFAKIESSVVSNLADVSNLEVALTDANGTFKIISLENIDQADLLITDEDTGTTLASETNFTGTYNYVSQITSTNIRTLVTRDGFTNWSASTDFTTAEDIFRYEVFQTTFPDLATSSNQLEQIYLLQKLLQKNEGILKELNGTTPNLTINSVTQAATVNATRERQEEITRLLERILAKTTAIRKSK